MNTEEQDAIEKLARQEAKKQADAVQKAQEEEQEKARKREEEYQARKKEVPTTAQETVPTGWNGRAHTLQDYAANEAPTRSPADLVHSQSRTASDSSHAGPSRR
ncbi:MAG: hypothetical protein EON54_02830 [Alcaligenaceae bacterium]|nr:MAG: hypothetical protein EON54_02830 [Alcaligenaceae bacterium]